MISLKSMISLKQIARGVEEGLIHPEGVPCKKIDLHDSSSTFFAFSKSDFRPSWLLLHKYWCLRRHVGVNTISVSISLHLSS